MRLLGKAFFMKNYIRRYRHAVWLLYLPFYFAAFFLAEKHITSGYWVSYSPLDDKIPFVEEFVVFYLLWFPAIWLVGLYLLFREPDAFRRYIWFIMIGYTVSLIIFFIFPNGQNLRPAVFEQSNVFVAAVKLFYMNDTNTNVLPSMHVIGASAVVFAVFDSEKLRKTWLRIAAVAAAVLIDASTVLIKQHSILDVWAGLAVSLICYLVVYQFIRRKQQQRLTPAYSGLR